jgi:predicted DNA-binding protein with PD1-like motif
MRSPKSAIRLAFAVGGATLGLATSLALGAVPTSPRRPAQPAAEELVVPAGVRAKLIGESAGARTYQLVLAPGTEAMGAIAEFVTANHIESAHFEGLGACTDAVLAYWDPGIRDYRKTQYRQQMEIVSIIGDAAPTPGDGAGLHAHMGVAFADGTMHGGHLFETHVSPTMELVLTASPTALHRRYDETFHAWLLAP